MPSLITHYLCGNAVYANYTILNHRSVFNLGTQGPDIFFYYNAWPWAKSEGIPKLGNRIHEEKTGEFISEALRYTSKSDGVSKNILTAYMCGYLCHYALDCRAHPYIFYRTGFIRSGEAYTPKYTCYHRMFETALDVLMLKRELGKRPSEFNAPDKIRISKQEAFVIAEMYSKVLDKVYAADISPELVCRSINDMIGITALLRDTTGIKKRLLYSMEKALKKPPMFSSMILPLTVDDGLDYLNASHSVWHLPWDISEKLTFSFADSFEAAISESNKIINTVLCCIDNGNDLESAMSLIGNRSFSTGEDCSRDLEFKYFESIYESHHSS